MGAQDLKGGGEGGKTPLDAGAGGPLLALTRDLFFASRIRAAADAAGVRARVLSGPGGLPEGEDLAAVRLALVDLEAAGALDAIARLSERGGGLRIVAFGSHVAATALEAARRAGAGDALPRSAFVRRLPELLEGLTRATP